MVERSPAKLLAAYRDAAGPSPAIEQRMLEVLHAQITLPPPPTGGGVAGGATTGAASAGGVKLAVVLTVVGGLAVAAATPWLRASVEPAPQPEIVNIEGEAVLAVEPGPPSPELAPAPVLVPELPAAAAHESAPAEPVTDPAVESAGEPKHAAPRRRSAPRARSEAPPAATLADEAQLLRSADAALRQGRLSEARSLLDRHARDFGHASLQAEAELLELLLACAERRPDAHGRATAWLTRQPSHPARTRIVELCEAADP